MRAERTPLLLLGVLLIPTVAESTTFFVAPDGDDRNGGGLGDPFATIQHGVDVMQPGDSLLLRAGTYREHSIRLWGKQGSEEAWFTLQSYPGEWAVVDAGHPADPVGTNVFESSSAPLHAPVYWRFAHFEVTGAGPAYLGQSYEEIQNLRGAGFHFWPGYHMVFDGMYIHDNYGGGGPNGGAGVKFQNADGTAAHHIVITHCHLKDNGWPGATNGNLANIVLFSDYVDDPTQVDLEQCLSRNEIAYNLVEGCAVGFKHKNAQWLCRNHIGDDMEGKAYGDRIHHNIFLNNTYIGLWVHQDFAQVHHNIVVSSPGGIVAARPPTTIDREPFHAVIYNNLVVESADGGGITSYHGLDPGPSGYQQEPWHPYWYVWNNIIERGQDANGRNDLNILFAWSPYEIDMHTVHVDHDYFYPRERDQDVINVVDNANDFSADEYEAVGWATSLYAQPVTSADPLHPEDSEYKTRPDHVLEAGVTLADGGLGAAHPYLPGVTIPAYVGPCADDACAWVDAVLACAGGVPSAVADRPPVARQTLTARPSIGAPGIRFRLGTPPGQTTRIFITDVNGRRIRALEVDGETTDVFWDGRDLRGRPAAAGVYWARVDQPGTLPALRVVVAR
jgi:hypothetical protein